MTDIEIARKLLVRHKNGGVIIYKWFFLYKDQMSLCDLENKFLYFTESKYKKITI